VNDVLVVVFLTHSLWFTFTLILLQHQIPHLSPQHDFPSFASTPIFPTLFKYRTLKNSKMMNNAFLNRMMNHPIPSPPPATTPADYPEVVHTVRAFQRFEAKRK
jgi:hypothetical protein